MKLIKFCLIYLSFFAFVYPMDDVSKLTRRLEYLYGDLGRLNDHLLKLATQRPSTTTTQPSTSQPSTPAQTTITTGPFTLSATIPAIEFAQFGKFLESNGSSLASPFSLPFEFLESLSSELIKRGLKTQILGERNPDKIKNSSIVVLIVEIGRSRMFIEFNEIIHKIESASNLKNLFAPNARLVIIGTLDQEGIANKMERLNELTQEYDRQSKKPVMKEFPIYFVGFIIGNNNKIIFDQSQGKSTLANLFTTDDYSSIKQFNEQQLNKLAQALK